MMAFEQDSYEDELDRMRNRKKRNQRVAPPDLEVFDLDEEYETVKRSHPQQKRRRKLAVWKPIALLLVCICGFLLFQHFRDDGYWTVAVFGVDSRDGNVKKDTHADVIMICSIDKKTGEIRLVSVFRDSYMNVGDDNYRKINEAYFYGGYSQAITALEDNLDIQIDDYATFNWKAVASAIDVLGGVDLEITDSEFAYINSFITETVNETGIGSVHLTHSGMNHLDGVQAVAYSRLRLMDTDFKRTERQRKVLGLAMDKAKASDFATLRTLVGAVFPEISTSIGVDDVLTIAKNAKKYYIGQTSGFPFSHSEAYIGKLSYVIPTTLESNVILLHEFLYDTTGYKPSARTRSISAHIAEVTGLGEPGKDTESGKNVGASGQSDGTSVPSTQAPAATTQAQQEVSTAAAEPESSSEEITLPEESAIETIESTEEPTTESTEPATEEPAPETTGQTSAGPGADEPAGQPEPGPGNPTTPQPSNALEGPGQSSGENSGEVGPGAQ
ncbi:MAG: LCP family protein [Lachnospiraceae bacterium]